MATEEGGVYATKLKRIMCGWRNNRDRQKGPSAFAVGGATYRGCLFLNNAGIPRASTSNYC